MHTLLTASVRRVTGLCLIFATAPSIADEPSDIVTQSQNPVASLISVPIQNNLQFGVGQKGDQADVLNIEPVVPLHLTPDWNVISRAIIPVSYEPYAMDGVGNTTGTGDINISLYLSPARTGSLIWGVGPSLTFPTASAHVLGQGKFSAGLSGAVLTISGHWVVGVLVTDIASIGGESNRENVHQMLVQPFLDYNLARGWYLSSSPIITANWMAPSSNRWAVPFGGGGGRLFRIGKQAINASIEAYGSLVRPNESSNWTLRMQVSLLFPK